MFHIVLAFCLSPYILLMRPFPSVVAPQIEARVAAYGLFEHLEETFCYFVVWQSGRGVADELEGADVFAAARTLHVNIKYGVVHLSHYALATGEDGSVVVKERQPQVDIAPLWRLVGDVSEEPHAFFPSVCYEIAQNILLRDAHAALGMAQRAEQFVENLAAQRMVDKSADGILMSRERETRSREHLPVAVMPEDGGTSLSLVEMLFQLLHVAEFDMLQECTVANRQQFQRLHAIVAEPAVESVLNCHQLFRTLFWKSRTDIFPYHFLSVSHYIIYNKVEEVGYAIQGPVGQERYCIEDAVDYSVCHGLEVLLLFRNSRNRFTTACREVSCSIRPFV